MVKLMILRYFQLNTYFVFLLLGKGDFSFKKSVILQQENISRMQYKNSEFLSLLRHWSKRDLPRTLWGLLYTAARARTSGLIKLTKPRAASYRHGYTCIRGDNTHRKYWCRRHF